MKRTELQLGFSHRHADAVFNAASRRQKAKKTLAVLADYLGGIDDLIALDIGCAAGNSTRFYAERLGSVIGIDIDAPAVEYAVRNNALPNLKYCIMDTKSLGFLDNTFDVIICTHIYEHVPDSKKLLDEIYRLLKIGGVCYFAAGNRLSIVEPHYQLPLLSVIPKPLAHYYLKILRRGDFYYENHLSYWGLRKLVAKFELIDYTTKVVKEPAKFFATELIRDGSIKQKIALVLLK